MWPPNQYLHTYPNIVWPKSGKLYSRSTQDQMQKCVQYPKSCQNILESKIVKLSWQRSRQQFWQFETTDSSLAGSPRSRTQKEKKAAEALGLIQHTICLVESSLHRSKGKRSQQWLTPPRVSSVWKSSQQEHLIWWGIPIKAHLNGRKRYSSGQGSIYH